MPALSICFSRISATPSVSTWLQNASPLQHQRPALEARHARHDLAAGAMVFLAQPVVVVDELAVVRDDVGLALATDAAAAEIGRIDAGRLDGFEQALLFIDADGLAADRERHVEGQAGLGGRE